MLMRKAGARHHKHTNSWRMGWRCEVFPTPKYLVSRPCEFVVCIDSKELRGKGAPPPLAVF